MDEMIKKQKVLIVDDMSSNIKVLGEALRGCYDISFARSGSEALEIVAQNLPDLILLDIMMPGIDGYEVCKRLRLEKKSRDVPIIFITARDTDGDETRGFKLGAVDYITKPFNPEIVKARVKTQLELKRHRDHLSEIVRERTSQLIHSDRLATLGTISAAVVHEIKNPLFYISGNAELVQQYIESGEIDKVPEKLERIIDGTKRISLLTENLKGYSRNKGGGKLICLMSDIIKDSVNIISYRIKKANVILLCEGIADNLKVLCDFQKMSQIFVNLISNAIDAIEDGDGEVEIVAFKDNDHVIVRVKDNGPGIKNDMMENIFEPFVTSKEKTQGTGLGLFIVRHIIEEHNGTISISQNQGSGAEFIISLPYCESL